MCVFSCNYNKVELNSSNLKILHFLKHCSDIVACLWAYAKVPTISLFFVTNKWPRDVIISHQNTSLSGYLLHEVKECHET